MLRGSALDPKPLPLDPEFGVWVQGLESRVCGVQCQSIYRVIEGWHSIL